MKKLISIAIVSALVAFVCLQTKGQAPVEPKPASAVERVQEYEYASFRVPGACFVWPDGTAEKLSDIQPKLKVPAHADHRMYLLTVAANVAAQRGFEPTHISGGPSAEDMFFRRRVNR